LCDLPPSPRVFPLPLHGRGELQRGSESGVEARVREGDQEPALKTLRESDRWLSQRAGASSVAIVMAADGEDIDMAIVEPIDEPVSLAEPSRRKAGKVMA
jgi:hypothetical protein